MRMGRGAGDKGGDKGRFWESSDYFQEWAVGRIMESIKDEKKPGGGGPRL